MTYKVKKGKYVFTVRDENQLAAFVNNGWTKVEEKVVKSTDKATTRTRTPKVSQETVTE